MIIITQWTTSLPQSVGFIYIVGTRRLIQSRGPNDRNFFLISYRPTERKILFFFLCWFSWKRKKKQKKTENGRNKTKTKGGKTVKQMMEEHGGNNQTTRKDHTSRRLKKRRWDRGGGILSMRPMNKDDNQTHFVRFLFFFKLLLLFLF